jgi:hypothetical protein
MTYTAKALARNSVNEFLQANDKQRNEMLYHVKLMLVIHNDAMQSIRIGFADRYVIAGELFIRWARIFKLDINESNPKMNPIKPN